MQLQMSRRRFLAASVATGLSAERRMQLSLSVRVAESFEKSNGYSALCMRASQAGVQTRRAATEEMARRIRSADLRVSMVAGDFAIPKNDDHGPECLRNITPYLDLAQIFGAYLIRISMQTESDIEWAAKACREAALRNIRLAHQYATTDPRAPASDDKEEVHARLKPAIPANDSLRRLDPADGGGRFGSERGRHRRRQPGFVPRENHRGGDDCQARGGERSIRGTDGRRE